MQMTELVAGRELDALVAEKVMGWPVDGISATVAYRERNMPAFSTDIAAAWQIVSHASEFDLCCSPNQTYWTCYIALASDSARITDAQSAPLAICRAALAAVSHG